ncbi:MAG: serine hydroxymethyltransferase [Flavobacteriales bacterium]|nr:serine hydroxymethyltransferase [Flavobacteriales bacterium]
MKFIGFLIFVFVFLMAFWTVVFLAGVIPYMIFVWAKEGKLESNQIPS